MKLLLILVLVLNNLTPIYGQINAIMIVFVSKFYKNVFTEAHGHLLMFIMTFYHVGPMPDSTFKKVHTVSPFESFVMSKKFNCKERKQLLIW